MSHTSYGVALFATQDSPSIGWKAVNGVSTPLHSIQDLDGDILWITNIPMETYKRFNVGNSINVLYNQYLRTSIDQLKAELCKGLSEKDAASRLSLVAGRVDKLCIDLLGIDTKLSPKYRLAKSLAPELQFGRPLTKGYRETSIQNALKASNQFLQKIYGRQLPSNSNACNLVVPRVPFFKSLLSVKMPSEAGYIQIRLTEPVVISQSTLENPSGRLRQLLDLADRKALFFEVKAKHIDAASRTWSKFGSGAQTQRTHACLPEIIGLSECTEFTLLSGIGYDYADLKQLRSVLDSLEEAESSFSVGVFLENLWAAMASEEACIPPRAPWLRAYDRMAMRSLAAAIDAEGVCIGGYGAGSINVWEKEAKMPDLHSFAVNIGLIPV